MTKIAIGEAAKILGVTQKTLRTWEEHGKITPERTPNGHRRYDRGEIVRLSAHAGKNRQPVQEVEYKQRTIAYARVSSNDQKEDLIRAWFRNIEN